MEKTFHKYYGVQSSIPTMFYREKINGEKFLVIEQEGGCVRLPRHLCKKVMEMADKFIPEGE
jgi:hypothetical protein